MTLSNRFGDTSSDFGNTSSDFGITTNRFADLDDGYKIGISLSDSDDDSESENEGAKDSGTLDDDVISEEMAHEQQKESGDENKGSTNDIAALNLKFRCIIQLLIEGSVFFHTFSVLGFSKIKKNK